MGLGEGSPAVVHVHPPLLLFADLALVALAAQTHHVSTLVAAYLLPMDFLPADPTTKLLLLLLYLQIPQLLQGEFVLAPRTVDDFGLTFYVVEIKGGVFEGPEGSFDILVLFGVEFVDADGFDFLVGERS